MSLNLWRDTVAQNTASTWGNEVNKDHLMHQFPKDQRGQSSQSHYFKNKAFIRPLTKAGCTRNMSWFQYCWGMTNGRLVSRNAMLLSKNQPPLFSLSSPLLAVSFVLNFQVLKNQFCPSFPAYGCFSGVPYSTVFCDIIHDTVFDLLSWEGEGSG